MLIKENNELRQSDKVMRGNEASLYQHEMSMGFKCRCCDEYIHDTTTVWCSIGLANIKNMTTSILSTCVWQMNHCSSLIVNTYCCNGNF